MATTQEMEVIVFDPLSPTPPPTSLSGVSPCYLRAAVIILPVHIMCIIGHWTGLAATMQVEWT